MARSTPFTTTMARASPPISFGVNTESLKWSMIMPAFWVMAYSWFSTYRRSLLLALFESNLGSSSMLLMTLKYLPRASGGS